MVATTKHKNIKPLTLQHLTQRPGSQVFLDDIVQFIKGVNKEEPRRQSVQNAIRALIDDDKQPIEIVLPGNCWRYQPNAPKDPAKRIFEELAVTKAGTILIQDQAGVIYKAEEIL